MQLTKYENVEIYKDDVIEALAFEPNLGFGYWLRSKDGLYMDSQERIHSSCVSCAVGSVLRGHFNVVADLRMTAFSLCEGDCAPYDLGNFAEDKPKSWMAALSFFWESLGHNNTPIEEARRLTIDFVEEYFPDEEVLAAFTVEKQITTNAFGKPV